MVALAIILVGYCKTATPLFVAMGGEAFALAPVAAIADLGYRIQLVQEPYI